MKPSLVLFGPILPFRGGIAQHTTALHRALSTQSDLTTLSFRRMYPAWLFPGASDRDPFFSGHREPGVQYVIDTHNPLSWVSAVKLASAANPAAAIIPWWTIYFAACFGAIARGLRRRNIPVVFLCHNVLEHEAARWKTELSRLVLAAGTSFFVHTSHDRRCLLEMFPAAKVDVHPHPVDPSFPEPRRILPRRAALELLFFGFQRPYKGVDILIEAMGLLRGRDICLTIAGEIWGRPRRERKLSERIEMISRYVSPEETAELFDRADVVVLPYRSATGSGVIPLAYRYTRPVIATRVGGLAEAVEHGETGLLVQPADPRALADAIVELSAERARAMRPAIARVAANMSFVRMAEHIIATAHRGS